MLSGLRGVGKTVLLLAFREHAKQAGWPVELFEARPGGDLRAQLAEALPPMVRAVNRSWRNKERAERIGRIAASFAKAVQARLVAGGFRLELEPEVGVADSGDLETDLTELLVALGEGAREEGLGAALLIDELHEVPPEQLSALVGAAHRVNQERLPVVVCGAGLPPVGRVLSEARSYAERLFSLRPVGALAPADTRGPRFERPAAELGVAFEAGRRSTSSSPSPAATRSSSRRYGKHVWDVADDSPIAADDVELARPRRLPRARCDSFFRPRYDRATPAERRYMHAMADLSATATRVRRPRSPPSSATTSPGGSRRSARACSPRASSTPRIGGCWRSPCRTWRTYLRAAHRSVRDRESPMTGGRSASGSPSITAIGAAWRLGYLVVAKLGDAAAAQRLAVLQHPGRAQQRGRLVPRGPDGAARRRARPADVAVADAVEPRRRRQRRLAAASP